MNVERFRHIAVEGAIGVGKTTLARRLAQALDAQLLLERPEDNPFLAKYYADPSRYALPTQLSFLFQRAEQAAGLMQSGMFASLVVSDFMFAKDRLFAQLTLSDDEYKLYERISADVAPPTPLPDLVLWLRASAPVLRERVMRRGRRMEQGLQVEQLRQLDQCYAAYFARETSLPVLVLETSQTDYEHGNMPLQALLQQIDAFDGSRAAFDFADA